VWNTFVRADHQLNTNNTYGFRWLRETSPQPLQIQAENHTPPRHEAETDVDWTLVGNLSSVIGSTKVNTFRVSAVTEDVFFGNPRFNDGEPQESLPPQLNFLSFQDQQSSRANRRLDVAYGADNVFAWFLPGKGGDHDMKFGANYLYSSLRIEDYGNQNGTFTLNTDQPFDRNNPRTYPERLSIRVPAAVNFLMKGHFIGLFAQDKWRINNNLTVNFGARYDVEILPTPNQDNPMFADNPDGYPKDTNNISPRLGFSWTPGGDGRSAVRGGFGVFYQRTSYTFLTPMYSTGARFSDSLTVMFPTNNIDPGPRAGNFPTDPMLMNGPVVNQTLLDSLYPPGSRVRNGGTVRFDNPDRRNAYSRQYSLGYERQIMNNASISVDYIRSEQRAQYILKELNPGVRNSTLATGTVTRTNPLIGNVGDWAASVVTLVNEGYIDYNTVQVSGTKRYSNRWQGRLSYAWSRGRGNTPDGQATEVTRSQFLDDLRLENEIGPTNVDRPHILTLSGTYDVPRTGGLKVSGVYSIRSGTPFSLVDTTFDADRNAFTANEYLPAGSYTGIGEDPFPIEYKGGRNGGRGPNYQRFDFRAGYRIRLNGGRTIDAFLDIFNLSNEPNFANPTNITNPAVLADRRLPATFMRLLATLDESPTRTAQVNLRFGF
jgi:hypothetical protein